MFKKLIIITCLFVLILFAGYNLRLLKTTKAYQASVKQNISTELSDLGTEIEWFNRYGTEGEKMLFISKTSTAYGMVVNNGDITDNLLLDEGMLKLSKFFQYYDVEIIKARSAEIAPVLINISKDLDNTKYCMELIDIIEGR